MILLQVGTANEKACHRIRLVSVLVVDWKPAIIMTTNKREGYRTQSQMEKQAKLDSASEKTSPYHAVQLNLKGSCRADGSGGSTTISNVCTYDVRTLWTEDDLNMLVDEIDQIKWNVIGFCETYRKQDELSKIKVVIFLKPVSVPPSFEWHFSPKSEIFLKFGRFA